MKFSDSVHGGSPVSVLGAKVGAWPERYRPGRFDDVAGQDVARDDLAGLVRAGTSASVLLSGSTGVGKTTLALIYAQAMLCLSPTPTGSPCGACSPCAEFQAGQPTSFLELGPARQNTRSMRGLAESARGQSWERDPVRVVHLSDADGLVGWRMLRDVLDLPAGATVIITADQTEAVPRAIRDRLRVIDLQAPTPRAIFDVLRRIASAEGITFEVEALWLIARSATNFREAIRYLERVATSSGLSTQSVLQRLGASATDWIAAYADAVGQGDLGRQVQALEGAGRDPGEVVTGLLNALAFLRLGAAEGDNGAGRMGAISEARRRKLHHHFHRAAQRLGVAVPDLWSIAASYWGGLPRLSSVAALRVATVGFQDPLRLLVAQSAQNGAGRPMATAGQVALSQDFEQRGPRVRRSADLTGQTAPDAFLSFEQVSELYEAATFALQAHWAPFNSRITLSWPDEAMWEPVAVARKIDRFSQGLQRAVERWGCADAGGGFSRLLLNRRDAAGRAMTVIVGHVPGRHREALRRWVGRQASKVEARPDLLPSPRSNLAESIATHWALMRDLWAGADPGLRVQNRFPLTDLLGVTAEERRPVGELFTGRRFSTSQNIGPDARRVLAAEGAPHWSAMADAAWRWIDTGWERREFIDRSSNGYMSMAEIPGGKRRSRKGDGSLARQNSENRMIKQEDSSYDRFPPWAVDLVLARSLEDEMAEINPLFPE